jgi:hypothetical protein
MKINLLNLQDPIEVNEFEQAFFKAFAHQAQSELSHRIWRWDHDNERISLRLDQDTVRIFVTRGEDRQLQKVLAINTDMEAMQCHHFGFHAPASDIPACEIAALFSQNDHSILHLHDFLKHTGTMLHQMGFKRSYTTCAPPLLHFYQAMGGTLIDTKIINLETRHFLHFDLTEIHQLKPFSQLAPHLQSLDTGSRNHALTKEPSRD